MFDVYAFATPNSIKVLIAFEELGLDYTLHAVNVRQGEQKTPDFMALNPNAKVPVLVDPDAEGSRLVLTESVAWTSGPRPTWPAGTPRSRAARRSGAPSGA